MLRSLSAKTLLTATGVVALSFAATAFQPARAADEMPTFEIHIKDHKFDPANFEVPADTRMKLVVHNDDPTPEEFESHDLFLEKIIPGGGKGTMYVGPLEAGTYHFFGEFNQATAQGDLTAK